MANDRLMIACSKCDECVALYKYYPASRYEDAGYVPDAAVARVNEFLFKHLIDCHGWGGMDLGSKPLFYLDTEGRDWPKPVV